MFANPRLAAAAIASAVLLAACAANNARQTTAAALTAILATDTRSQENRARDGYRPPRSTLFPYTTLFRSSVLEVWPEPGWYTEVIAPLVRDKGKYYAAVIAADPESPYITQRLEKYRQALAAHPELYDRVAVVTFPADGGDAVPPASVDMVVTFRNIHNWMGRDTAAQAFATMYRALKPGGVLGVGEHRGNPAVAQEGLCGEGARCERLMHLLGHEAAAPAVHVRIRLPRLVGEMKLERHDQEQVVLRAGERDIQQPPLLLDELRFAGRELGRKGAIHDVQHVDGVPLHALRRMDGRQHQVVLIEARAAGEVAGGVRRIECELGEEAFARRILPR